MIKSYLFSRWIFIFIINLLRFLLKMGSFYLLLRLNQFFLQFPSKGLFFGVRFLQRNQRQMKLLEGK